MCIVNGILRSPDRSFTRLWISSWVRLSVVPPSSPLIVRSILCKERYRANLNLCLISRSALGETGDLGVGWAAMVWVRPVRLVRVVYFERETLGKRRASRIHGFLSPFPRFVEFH